MIFPHPAAATKEQFINRITQHIFTSSMAKSANNDDYGGSSAAKSSSSSSSRLVRSCRHSLSMMAITPSTCGIANLLPIIKSPYSLRKVLLLLLLTTFLSVISLYTFHRGFRRTIQFWRGMAPLILEYKYVNFKADRIDHCSSEELERRLDVYRTSTAPKLVDLILRMGGIYIKLGQGECVKVGRKNKTRNQSWAVFHSFILRYDLRVRVCCVRGYLKR